MAQPQIYGAISWVKLGMMTAVSVIFLSGCSVIPEPEVQVVTEVQKITVPIVARPKPIDLVDTRVYVVNEQNLEAFIEKFKAENGDLAYVALSVKDYENLALNVAELRRFINQQTEIIIYYENAMKLDE
jgi:hypothetical protein